MKNAWLVRGVALLCSCAFPVAEAAETAVLDSAGARAVFDRSRNGVLTGFGRPSGRGRVSSLLLSLQPVFHHADPKLGVYWAHLSGPDNEFGRIHKDRVFRAESMALRGKEWRVVAKDHYVRVSHRSRFVPGTPALEMTWRFEALRDTQESSWTTLASLRFRSPELERFFPTYRVADGAVLPVVSKTFAPPGPNPNSMENWFVVRDGKTGEGLLVLFPKLRGRSFIQRAGSYLSITSPYTEDKFVPKGEVYEFKVWLVPFRGDFGPTLKAWGRRVGFNAFPLLRATSSPTGTRLAETDELLVWSETPNRKVLREEKAPARKAARVNIMAARGEYEPFQLVVRGKPTMPYTRMERIEFIPSDLKRKGGGVIPSANIETAVEEFMNLRWPKGRGWSGPTPDGLRPARHFACDPGANTVIWTTVKVPLKTPPGVYDGAIDLWHGMGRRRRRIVTIPLQVRVLGFTIPDKRHFTAWLPFTSRRGIGLLYKGRDPNAVYKRLVENYVEHRTGLRFVVPNVRFKKGSAEIERIRLKAFEETLRHHFEDLKMPAVNCRAFNFGAGHKLCRSIFGGPKEALTPLWRARCAKLAKVLGDFLREKGWQDRLIFELFDEPVNRHIPMIAEVVKILKKEFPEIRVTYAAMWIDPRLFGQVNVWMTGGGYAYLPTQKRRAAGDTIWFGNNGLAGVDQRAALFRATWWRYWVDGISGCNHWHVGEGNDWLRRGRWGRNRIATWLLPGEDGPVNTIRWELTREGLEDLEYLWLLEQAVARAKAAGPAGRRAAAEGERALTRVREVVLRKGRLLSYNPDPVLVAKVREAIGLQIEKMKAYLPEEGR